MLEQKLHKLFEPLKIGNITLKNRIMSTAHDTAMPTDGMVNERLIAYHEARAEGGVGLIILQVSGVHESARYTTQLLMATEDASIPHYKKLADRCHKYGTKIFAQLFHPGREIMESGEGLRAIAYAPSAVPNERFHVLPKPLTKKMIHEILDGYGDAARRIFEAGIDGVEIVMSHGYLPSQFLNEHTNQRDDEYGGSFENRLRFTTEIIEKVREKTSKDFIIGIRISSQEYDDQGLSTEDVLAISQKLEPMIDYINVTSGTSSSLAGAVHIVPPMAYSSGFLAPESRLIKEKVNIPVFVTGRINQPQDAELILQKNEADVCGMTRAMICDPEMPNKAADNLFDDIRACIGCNQACIDHFHRGFPISCIQHPETGRELQYGTITPTNQSKKVMVIGAGPAGMKAAITAKLRGHDVTLYESSKQLGGQVKLAQMLPRREEFGGVITNLSRELELAGVNIKLNHTVNTEYIQAQNPDVIILATGAKPYTPTILDDESIPIFNSWDLLSGEKITGSNVLVYDWKSDWIAPSICERLVSEGYVVQLAINGLHLGETLPLYVRDNYSAEAHRLGIKIIPNMRLYGSDSQAIYMQHNTSHEPEIFENIDALVICGGHESVDPFGDELDALAPEVFRIGDCATARTVEEAVYEGLTVGSSI